MIEVYYFGCLNDTGHYLFGPSSERNLGMEITPWATELDMGLCPKNGRQRQGEALLHHKDGWTALAWWDRSIDKRPNSNSAIVAVGTHIEEALIQLMWKYWPTVGDRQPVKIYWEPTDA